jgi:hypothetical protein
MAGNIPGVTVLSGLSLDQGGLHITSGGSVTVPSGVTLWITAPEFSLATITNAGSLSSRAGLGMMLGLVFAASGISLVARSGNTIYTIGGSSTSAAAP